MNINDVNRLKENLESKTTRGFGYFMKNVGMILLLFVFIFILTNPNCITNPVEFFKDFKIDSLWVVFTLFCSVAGFYQLSKSIQNDNREVRKEERINEYEEAMTRKAAEVKKEHAELASKRLEASPLIDLALKDLIINLDADRAAIIEMHNGTNNTSGLPFIYGDMAYEQISTKVSYAQDEFKNFNLAKLPFVALHYKDKTWVGSTEDIAKEDGYFAAKLRVVNAEYGAFVTIEGINGPIGFLTLHFQSATNHPSKAKIIAEVTNAAQRISTLLDRSRY